MINTKVKVVAASGGEVGDRAGETSQWIDPLCSTHCSCWSLPKGRDPSWESRGDVEPNCTTCYLTFSPSFIFVSTWNAFLIPISTCGNSTYRSLPSLMLPYSRNFLRFPLPYVVTSSSQVLPCILALYILFTPFQGASWAPWVWELCLACLYMKY